VVGLADVLRVVPPEVWSCALDEADRKLLRQLGCAALGSEVDGMARHLRFDSLNTESAAQVQALVRLAARLTSLRTLTFEKAPSLSIVSEALGRVLWALRGGAPSSAASIKQLTIQGRLPDREVLLPTLAAHAAALPALEVGEVASHLWCAC
jgi:hypothetical protein